MLRFRRARLLIGVLGGLGLFAFAAQAVQADVFTTLKSVDPSTGGFNWNYDANVTNSTGVQTGDYFELIDFKGYNGTHSEPTGWTLLTSSTGPVPPGLVPADDPSITNLVWQYNGSTTLNGPMGLGTFTAGSSSNTQGTAAFVALTHLTGGLGAGTTVSNLSSVTVPGGISPSDTAVPEPTTLALLVVGLPVVITRACRWRRQRASLAQAPGDSI